MEDGTPTYLTTKEVADLIRVKERKVYDLAAANEIPHRRVTGKLLFPVEEITRWIEGDSAAAAERPAVLTGSHDPLLDWALRESGADLSTLWNGSADGFAHFVEGKAALAGLHLPEDEGWNIKAVSQAAPPQSVLVTWAKRSRGLLLNPSLGDQIRGLDDLCGKRLVHRQAGAGAATLLEKLIHAAGIGSDDFAPVESIARTETDAAAMVAAGEADAALGIEAMARQFNLGFAPLLVETYDLLIDWRSYFLPPFQTLLRFTQTDAFAAKASAMGGYDLRELGAVRWVAA